MQNHKKLLASLATVAALGCALPIPAQAEGIYIGAGAYRSDSDIGDDTVPAGFLGYTFVDTNFLMLSLEAGYYDLGDASDKTEKLDASAVTAGGMVSLPLGPFFELYAKAGVAFLDSEFKQGNGNTNKNSDEEAYYGAGFAFDIFDTIDIYAEYVVFDTDYDSDMAGVGIRLAF